MVGKEESALFSAVFPANEIFEGFFFSHGILDQTPILKLRKAANIDELELPVRPETLRALVRSRYIQRSQPPAPMEGTKHPIKTGLPEEVSKRSWELQPNQILQKNKRWAHEINKIKPHIKEDLGLHRDKIRFTLHKVLVYEPGSYLEAQRDSEAEPAADVIGTLFVQVRAF